MGKNVETGRGTSIWEAPKTVHDDIAKVLLDAGTIQARVRELGQQLSRDYEGKNPVLICILKGAAIFMADLVRHISIPARMDFMAISSYGGGVRTSGVVRILKDLDSSIEGQHVVIVEDIVDSGLTLTYLLDNLQSRHPASLRTCVLLDKPGQRRVPLKTDYVGFEIPDEFVVGYGLDYAENYRHLPYIGVLKAEVYNDPE